LRLLPVCDDKSHVTPTNSALFSPSQALALTRLPLPAARLAKAA
jgi:hypothetical protein